MATASDPAFLLWKDAARSTPIADAAREHNLALKGGVEKVGPCPKCTGKDRFSINTRKNVWRCNQCKPNGGDVIELVQFVLDCDFLTACETLTGQTAPDGKNRALDQAKLDELTRKAEARKAKAAAEEERRREQERTRAFEIWETGVHPAGTPVEAYLRLRGLELPHRTSLKFGARVQLFGEKDRGSRPLLHTGPAMLAAIVSPQGRFAGVHMTFLDLAAKDGKFRTLDPATGELTPAKKMRGSKKGGRIELVRVKDPTGLVTGEGNETVLSAWIELREAGRDLSRTAFWGALDLGNLGGPAVDRVAHPTLKDAGGRPVRVPNAFPKDGPFIPVPDSVEDILILGDGDSDPFTTRNAVDRASRRWSRTGRTIRGAFAPPGTDFNDIRRGR